MIKYNNSNINDWNFGEDNIIKVYRNNAVCYQKMTSGTTPPTPPTPTGCTYNFCGTDANGNEIIVDNGTTMLNKSEVSAATEGYVGEATTVIGEYCFDSAPISSLTISNTVTDIDHEAFQDAQNITSLTIPSSVSGISFWVFARMTSCLEVIFENTSVFTNTAGWGAPFHDWYPPVIYVPDSALTTYRTEHAIEWWIDGVNSYPNINDWIQPISNRT